jgi:hypothetical protein
MSGGLVPYHLRPNKSVDRYLFVELLAKVNRFKPITFYSYVGFGGPFLEDFKLIHNQFGNKKMISIEIDPNVLKRQEFNLPLSCIERLNQSSGDFIASYSIEGNAVIWLDYTDPRKIRLQIQEFESLLSKLQTYDVVKITLNANPETLRAHDARNEEGKRETTEERNEKRLEKLSERLGDYLPHGATSDMMTIDGLPQVLCRALEFAANNAMKGRLGNIFQPLAAFAYADSQHQMLTLTGIILPRADIRDFFRETAIRKWRLSATDWRTIHKIKLPELTAREKLFIDRHLPKSNEKRIQKKLKFLFGADEEQSLEVLKSYVTFYRHYPNYIRAVF